MDSKKNNIFSLGQRPNLQIINNQLSIINVKANPISTVPVGDSGVIYAKKITKNYEIFQNNPKIYSQKVYISHHFFHSFPFFFYYFYALFCTFLNFFQLLDQSTQNSMHNKDLHNFFTPDITHRASRIEHRKNAKRTQFQPATYAIRYTQYEIIYAKQTQFHTEIYPAEIPTHRDKLRPWVFRGK